MIKIQLRWVLLAAGFCSLLGGTAHAKMYKYTDRGGQDHYVDSPSKIPQEYRDRQEEVQPVRNESRAAVPYSHSTPRAAPAQPAGVSAPTGKPDPNCARKLEQAERDLEELQKKAVEWEKEHPSANGESGINPSVERAAQVAVEKCLGGAGNVDPEKAMALIQQNQDCISKVSREEKAEGTFPSDNPYVKRVDSAQSDLKRLKAQCGG